ncbi:MAG TPA: hypothetical protein VGC09_03625 [Rhodopila sp.]
MRGSLHKVAGYWLVPAVVPAALAAVLCAAPPAFAGERGAVCREPSVVDEMTREIRDHYYYSEVDPRLVTETPTSDAVLVHCQVCVQSAPYDTIRSGEHPIARCLAHEFEVRILHSGFRVRDLQ